jgi:uridine monophosphate synthetase
MIIVRDKIKEYGTQKQIEGEFNKDDKCIIIEDIITTGNSVQDVLEILKNKINVIGIVVVMKRNNLININGINIYNLINKNDITKYKLSEYIKNKKSRLCFSADLDNPEDVIKILGIIGKYIVICKIHFDIYKFTEKYNRDKFKEDLIDLSNSEKFLLMEDRKFFDTSYIVEKQYNYFKEWIDIVTVHGLVTDDVITKIDCSILLIANMSNNNFDFTESCIKICKNNNNILGFITQKKIKHNDLLNFTPGISLDETIIDDQQYKNIDNIDEKNKPDIIIVGRTIYNSANILETIKLINNKFY